MKHLFYILTAGLLLVSCGKQTKEAEKIAMGADLGWLSEMEHDGMLFYNAEGVEQGCMDVLQGLGCNAIRLRVWVNHETGWCNLPDVLMMARRVKAAGLDLMVDFHYSDYWADPQTQTIPAAWKEYDEEQMAAAIAAHTTEVLEALKAENITPKWVQIGNETTNGMLWPMAALDKEAILADAKRPALEVSKERQAGWATYAKLSNAGYDAAKAVFPEVICIVHVDNAFIPRANWFYRFQQEGGKWDMVGLSHYPFTQDTLTWEQMNTLAMEDIRELHQVYGCRVMVTEIGTASWDAAAAEACITDYRSKTDTLAGYAGVFYWEPEVYADWKPAEYEPLGWGAYHMGCFDAEGKPMKALELLWE